jgi:hypothetical protein
VTITNGYCSLAQLQTELRIRDTDDDTRLEIAIAAASRQIDGYCGQRFWQDGSVVAREFFAEDCFTVRVPEGISTVTGLIVKTDDNDDGTFETTHTITTEFIVSPVNAADEVPVRPFSCVRMVDGDYFPMSTSGRPGVQITAKFGWPAVPDDVTKAALIQATQLFKASDAAFGGVSLGIDGGVLRVRQALNPMAQALLEPYVRVE